MELWEVVAREEIKELVAAYNHLGDSGRMDEMTSLFLPDATLDGFGDVCVGHEAIAGFFHGVASGATSPVPAATPRTFLRHHLATISINVESPDEASGKSYWANISDGGLDSSGRYWDTYRRIDDGPWRFATRKIRRDAWGH